MWENSTPTHNDFSKIQEEFKRAKKTVRNMSFSTVNEEEPKFDCAMMELQETDMLSVPAEYLNENELQMQFSVKNIIAVIE